jgi:hypothetical protein
MFEPYASARTIDVRQAAGALRQRQLEEWVVEDQARVALGLSPIAHFRWRDEVILRLPSFRPMTIRIPRTIVTHLFAHNLCGEGLLLHRVAKLLVNGEVVEEVHVHGSPVIRANVVVPVSAPKRKTIFICASAMRQ